MRRANSLLVLLFCVSAALAKDKPRITIQVLGTETSTRQFVYRVPGSNGYSTTNCSGNATAVDLGGGMATTNGTTNCTTTTTPGTAPSTRVGYIPQAHVRAIMPDGTHITLWCQRGFRHCDTLSAGYYPAEIDGNSVWMFGHDLGDKEHKIKYRYVGGW